MPRTAAASELAQARDQQLLFFDPPALPCGHVVRVSCGTGNSAIGSFRPDDHATRPTERPASPWGWHAAHVARATPSAGHHTTANAEAMRVVQQVRGGYRETACSGGEEHVPWIETSPYAIPHAIPSAASSTTTSNHMWASTKSASSPDRPPGPPRTPDPEDSRRQLS